MVGRNESVHQATLRVQANRWHDDQLSSAAQHVAGHDSYFRRRRVDDTRLLGSGPREVSFLQLRRHDADRVERSWFLSYDF